MYMTRKIVMGKRVTLTYDAKQVQLLQGGYLHPHWKCLMQRLEMIRNAIEQKIPWPEQLMGT